MPCSIDIRADITRVRPSSTLGALGIVVCVLLLLFSSRVAVAQGDSSMNEMLEQIGSQKGKGYDKSPVGRPTSAQVNLNVHWKLWKRMYAAGQAGEKPLAALLEDGRSLGKTNQLDYAMAVAALAAGAGDYDVGRAMFDGAQALAPQLPYPHLLQAAYVIERQPARLPHWVNPWWRGVQAGALWPDTSYPWMLKLFSYLLFGLVGACVVFVLGQFLRNFPIVAYDFARVLPSGFSSNQAALVLVALIAVPGLVLKSALASLLILLALCTLVQRPNERVISLLTFGLLAALPIADDAISRLATYPRSVAQTIVRAQWVECTAACREEIDALAIAKPDDAVIRYTALLAAYREGSPTSLQRVVEEVDAVEWPGEIVGYAHNLQGAAHVALANPRAALEVLQLARDEIRTVAAPAFNMMRAQQMMEDPDAAANSLQEAGARDIDVVAVHLELERRDVNSFLVVDALPLRLLWRYQLEHPDPATQVATIAPVWAVVAGDAISFEQTKLVGGAGMLLVLLGFGVRRRTSTPCPRCGQARDPSEHRKTGNHLYCVPCYSTFIMGSTLAYEVRLFNEKVLGRRQSFQRLMRRFSGLVIPGLGHQTAGHAGTGFILTLAIVFAFAIVLHPLGLVRAPQELVGTNWSGQVGLAWAVIVVCVFTLLSTAMRDLEPAGLASKERR